MKLLRGLWSHIRADEVRTVRHLKINLNRLYYDAGKLRPNVTIRP